MKAKIRGPILLELTSQEAERLIKLIGRTSASHRVDAKLAYSLADDPLSELYSVLYRVIYNAEDIDD